MKKKALIFVIATGFIVASNILAADNTLATVQDASGRTVTIARVSAGIDATMTVGQETVSMRDVQDIRFHGTPEHTLYSNGNTFLVGGATVVLANGRELQGAVRVQSNLTTNPVVYARSHGTEQPETGLVNVPALSLNGRDVPFSDIRSIEFLTRPQYSINWKGAITGAQQARVTRQDGEIFIATVRQNYADTRLSAIDGLVVVPFNAKDAAM